jgi:hypothetical protein
MIAAEGRDSFDGQFSLVYEELRRLAAIWLKLKPAEN